MKNAALPRAVKGEWYMGDLSAPVRSERVRFQRVLARVAPGARLVRWMTGVAMVLGTGMFAAAGAQVQTAEEPPSAVVLMYHRFGEEGLPSTNIRLDQFKEHIAILTDGRYRVLPLEEIVEALAQGSPLPDRTVAITIDDTSRSVFTEALPRLQAAGLPFTLFVNTDSVGQIAGTLSWLEIRAMAEAGVTIGAHSAAHGHMAFMDRGTLEQDFARMTSTFLRELGYVPRLYAYPYGEYSAELVAMIENAGYLAAFGQHSGVAVADLFTLPRFALNERYGETGRFAMIVDTMGLPVTDILPEDMPIRGASAANPPLIGFTAEPAAGPLHRLACFASNGAEVDVEFLGDRRVEIRLDRPFGPGRSRLNCTLPTPDGRFRWLGLPFVVPGGEE